MSQLTECPVCGGSYAYEEDGVFYCPECGHEWEESEEDDDEE